GLGCGARSYTRGLHYAREFAVGAQGIREILADYLARPAEAFAAADYGCRLGPEDQRRRYLLQGLLQCPGLDLAAYRRRAAPGALADLPELAELAEPGLADCDPDCPRLTAAGLERSDVIGPWLYSARVQALMSTFEMR